MSALQLDNAELALKLLLIIKALLDIAVLLAKCPRRPRRRGRPGRPRRGPRRSTRPRRGQGPNPGPGRGRAPPGRRRARRDSPVKRHEPPIFRAGSEKPRSNGASPEKVSAHSENYAPFA